MPRPAHRGVPKAQLTPPHLPSYVLERPRLVERLSHDAACRLTCVAAPAGYGKTVLLAQFQSHADKNRIAVARVALDNRDVDPQYLSGHLVQVLVTCWGGASGERLGRLAADAELGPRFVDAVLGAVSTCPETLIAFDDLQVLPAPLVTELGSLIAHTPDQLHFVLSSRAELLSVERIVGRNAEVATLTPEDLAFDREEIRYLGERLGVALHPGDVDELYIATEGWPLGVLYALRGVEDRTRRDTAAGCLSLPGRFTIQYVRHEVLGPLPGPLRSFVLSTSVPDEFSTQLADALTGRQDSGSLIDELIGKGVRLQSRGHDPTEFAYPPMLRACFRAELRTSAAGQEEALLSRGAEWHLLRGDFSLSIEYLLRAQAFTRVIEVLTERAYDLYCAGLASSAVRWMRAIPAGILRRNPAGTLCFTAMCQETGEAAAAEALLVEFEDEGCTDTELFRWVDAIWCLGIEHRAPATEVLRRADRLLERDGVPKTTDRSGDRVRCRSSRSAHLQASIASVSGGRALAGLDRHEEAWRWFMAGLADPTAPPHFRVQLLGALARSEATVGRLHSADHHAKQALALASEIGAMHDLECAEAYLALGIVGLEEASMPVEEVIVLLAEAERRARANRRSTLIALITAEQARVLLFTDRVGDGMAALQARRAAGDPDPPPAVAARLVAIEAELLLVAGKTSQAGRVVAEAPLVTAEVAAARTHLAVETAAHDEAALTRVLDSWPTDDGMRPHTRTSRLLWQALAAQLRGETDRACGCLEDALRVAEIEGLRRIFHEVGIDKLHGLARLLPSSIRSALADLAWPASFSPVPYPGGRVLATSDPHVEALSVTELVVLRSLARGVDNGELAAQLFISVNTLKTHLKHIYRKLGVTSRLQAVLRAEHLGLLGVPVGGRQPSGR